jgi:bifunctional DNA-binding transcriptional regulator/antitoxin component of YhaV-PrlF toxin-antitoxin module
MSNITFRAKFEKMDCMIWKKSQVDAKGRCVLPKKLRQKLGLNSKSSVLWISAKHKNGKDNEFILEIGVKNKMQGH